VAERLNRVLMERARALLIESGLPDEMWAEAVVTANYIRNRTPMSAHGKDAVGGLLWEEAGCEPHEGVRGPGLHARARGIEAQVGAGE
jgi:hypothetical protein